MLPLLLRTPAHGHLGFTALPSATPCYTPRYSRSKLHTSCHGLIQDKPGTRQGSFRETSSPRSFPPALSHALSTTTTPGPTDHVGYLVNQLERALVKRDSGDCWELFYRLEGINGLDRLPCALWRRLAFVTVGQIGNFYRKSHFVDTPGEQYSSRPMEKYEDFLASMQSFHHTIGKAPQVADPQLRQRLRALADAWLKQFPQNPTEDQPKRPQLLPENYPRSTQRTTDIFRLAAQSHGKGNSKPPVPTSYTDYSLVDYRLLFYLYHLLRDPARCRQVLRHMNDNAKTPTIVDLNALLLSYQLTDQSKGFRQVLHLMEQWKVPWNAITYNIVISFTIREGDLTTAHRYLDEMVELGYARHATLFSDLILAYANTAVYGTSISGPKPLAAVAQPDSPIPVPNRQRYLEAEAQVDALFRRMRCMNSLQWSFTTTNNLVKAFGLFGKVDRSWALFYELLQVGDPGIDFGSLTPPPVDEHTVHYAEDACRPGLFSYSIIINVLITGGKPERIPLLYNYLAQQEPSLSDCPNPALPGKLGQANDVVLTDFMVGLAHAGHANHVRAIFKSLCVRGQPLALMHINKVLKAFSIIQDFPVLMAIYKRLTYRHDNRENPPSEITQAVGPPTSVTDRNLHPVEPNPTTEDRDFLAFTETLRSVQEPNAFTFSIVLNTCVDEGELQWVPVIHRDITLRSDCLQSAVLQVDLLTAYCARHEPQVMERILFDWLDRTRWSKEKRAARTPSDFSTTRYPANWSSKTSSPLGGNEAGTRVITAADYASLHLNIVLCQRLLVAFAKVGRWKWVYPLLDYLENHLVLPPNLTTFHLLMRQAVDQKEGPAIERLARLGGKTTTTETDQRTSSPVPTSRDSSRSSREEPRSTKSPVEDEIAYALHSHAAKNDVRAVQVLLQSLASHKSSLTREVCNQLLLALLTLGQGKGALALFRAMIKGAIKPASLMALVEAEPGPAGERQFTTTILPLPEDDGSRPTSVGRASDVITLGSPDTSSCLALLRAYRQRTEWQNVRLVSRYLNRQWQWVTQAHRALVQKPSDQVLLNPDVIGELITCFGQMCDRGEVLKLEEKLRWWESYILAADDHVYLTPPQIHVWNILIYTYGQLGDIRGSVWVYNSLLEAFFATLKKDVKPFLISLTGRPIHSPRGSLLQERSMLQVKPAPVEGTFRSMVKAVVECRSSNLLEVIFRGFVASKIPYTTTIYTEFTRALSTTQQWPFLLHVVLPQMRAHRVSPSLTISGLIVHQLCLDGKVHIAERVLLSSFDPTEQPINLRLKASESIRHPSNGGIDDTPIVFQTTADGQVIAQGGFLPIDHITVRDLMHHLGKSRRVDRMIEWLKPALETNTPQGPILIPDIELINTIVSGFVRAKLTSNAAYLCRLLLDLPPETADGLAKTDPNIQAMDRLFTLLPHELWSRHSNYALRENPWLFTRMGIALMEEKHIAAAVHLWQIWEGEIWEQLMTQGTQQVLPMDSLLEFLNLSHALLHQFYKEVDDTMLTDMGALLLSRLNIPRETILGITPKKTPVDNSSVVYHPYTPAIRSLMWALLCRHEGDTVRYLWNRLQQFEQGFSDDNPAQPSRPILTVISPSMIPILHSIIVQNKSSSQQELNELIEYSLSHNLPLAYSFINDFLEQLVKTADVSVIRHFLERVTLYSSVRSTKSGKPQSHQHQDSEPSNVPISAPTDLLDRFRIISEKFVDALTGSLNSVYDETGSKYYGTQHLEVGVLRSLALRIQSTVEPDLLYVELRKWKPLFLLRFPESGKNWRLARERLRPLQAREPVETE
ncbi:hypothetical protein IWQ62_000462 [Dispira parvispora]|uniref:Pentatricopeptide repeat-containing protein n=1 Tax=Dispira parvispora TaxID=1520584 RepID=A0A9W8B048_9FUNG|nr:hypothetical protein IWQ62_000462 [Dispira parvispora]